MSASEGQIGFGSLVKIGNGASPEVFTTIGEMFDCGPVGATKPLVDFTHTESPDKYKEFKTGLAEGDEIQVSCNWKKSAGNAGQAAIRTAFNGGIPVNFKVYGPATPAPADEVASFSAIVTHHDVARPIEDRMVFNFTMKITGPITYGAT